MHYVFKHDRSSHRAQCQSGGLPPAVDSRSAYGIRWISQFPTDEAGERATFRDRIAGLIFGQKPEVVVKPFSVVAVDTLAYWNLDQGTGRIMKINEGDGHVLKSMKKSDHEPGEFWMPGGIYIDQQDWRCKSKYRIGDLYILPHAP